LKNVNIIKDEVVELKKNEITLKNKKSIKYFDFVVVCSGCEYNINSIKFENITIPIVKGNCINDILQNNEKFLKSDHITVIGIYYKIKYLGSGGVGIELTGVICEKYSNKKITIISSMDSFLDRLSDKAHDHVYKYFKEFKNVELVFGEKVCMIKGNTIITSKNREMKTDFVFSCMGFVPRNSFLKSNFELDNFGYMVVDSHLRSKSFENVFGAGDCINLKDEKLAQYAEDHAELVSRNILKLIQGKELSNYKPKSKMFILSMGQKSIFIFGKIVYVDVFLFFYFLENDCWKYEEICKL
jgi:apoptosis-inducing factor 2